MGPSLLLGCVFLALAYALSSRASEKSSAAGQALGLWFFFVLLFDLALLAILVLSQGHLSPRLLPWLLLLNPTDLYRLINLSGFDAAAAGMAPFLSVIQDPETYERYEKVILVHGVRWVSELAYADFITKVLPEHEYFGDQVKEKLIYYPLVTREPFRNQGRQTDLMRSGKLFEDIGLPPMNPQDDRAMINLSGFDAAAAGGVVPLASDLPVSASALWLALALWACAALALAHGLFRRRPI